MLIIVRVAVGQGRNFDQFGAYGWLYIGSFVIGFGAGAIGLFLPPLPSRLRSIPQSA